MKTMLMLCGVGVLASGCTSFGASQMFEDSDSGFVMLAGDAAGIKAYNDGLLGHITETKTSPDVKGPYWQAREKETEAGVLKLKIKRGGK